VVLSWPTNAGAFVLNGTPTLTSPAPWAPVPGNITIDGTNFTITIDASSHQFYKLIAP